MKDIAAGRNYDGLKLACWLAYGSYWQNTLRPTQAFNLVERTLHNREVDARWPNLHEVDVLFPTKGSTAWAERKRGGKGVISLPPGTLTPLVILHEFAHLLPATKRESDHGPGFAATHLMLVELMAPKALPALLAAYHATHTRYDPSLIPEPTGPSKYVPIVGSAAIVTRLQAVLASGTLTPDERHRTLAILRRIQAKGVDEWAPNRLPNDIRIPTEALLRTNTQEEIAELVLNELRDEVMPQRMRLKRKPKSTAPRKGK